MPFVRALLSEMDVSDLPELDSTVDRLHDTVVMLEWLLPSAVCGDIPRLAKRELGFVHCAAVNQISQGWRTAYVGVGERMCRRASIGGALTTTGNST